MKEFVKQYFMRYQFGCGTGIAVGENAGYYFTDTNGIIGKHNVEIITREEYDALNKFYGELPIYELQRKIGISYMDGLKDLEFIRQQLKNGNNN